MKKVQRHIIIVRDILSPGWVKLIFIYMDFNRPAFTGQAGQNK
jgi:hypothetical protein